MKLAESEVSAREHAAALETARGHWLLALSELEEARRRPCLILVGGLQGTGKSTLAQALSEQASIESIRSDEVRKSLAGAKQGERLSPDFYSLEWTERTYAECLRRAEQRLFGGGRLLIDATFREEHHRRLFRDAARRWGVPALWLLCQANAATVCDRLAGRRGDVSDADWSVYLQAASQWEEPAPATRRLMRIISTDGTPDDALGQAMQALGEAGLA
jgi:predicted kinase